MSRKQILRAAVSSDFVPEGWSGSSQASRGRGIAWNRFNREYVPQGRRGAYPEGITGLSLGF